MKKKVFRERYAEEEGKEVHEIAEEIVEESKPKGRGRKKSDKSDK